MTTDECITQAAKAYTNARAACAQMTPREQAEAAQTATAPWFPEQYGEPGRTEPYTVDELEDRIRVRRGLPRIHDAKSA